MPKDVRSVRGFWDCVAITDGSCLGSARWPAPYLKCCEWSEKAFVHFKTLLEMSPNLAYPEFNKPFVVHTDASGEGLETVLEQEQQDKLLHPVAITSQTLSKSERKNGVGGAGSSVGSQVLLSISTWPQICSLY